MAARSDRSNRQSTPYTRQPACAARYRHGGASAVYPLWYAGFMGMELETSTYHPNHGILPGLRQANRGQGREPTKQSEVLIFQPRKPGRVSGE